MPLLPLLLMALPDPGELIRRDLAAWKAQEARHEQFTWKEEEVKVDEKGQPIKGGHRIYDVIMLAGDNYRKLLTIDGQPLDAKTQKKVDEDLEKTRRQRESHSRFRTSVSPGGVEVLERLFDNKVTGEETVNGRKAWRVESEPKAGLRPADDNEADALATRRITWFDEEEGVDVRTLTIFVRNRGNIQAGSELENELGKAGDCWVFTRTVFRWRLKVMPGIGGRGTSTYRYYDHRRFTAESTFIPN